MKFKSSIVALLLVALTISPVAAPAQAATPKSIALQIGHEGGFVAPRVIKYALPDHVVYNTGMVLSNDRMGFRSDVSYLSQRTLTKAEQTAWAKKLYLLTKTPAKGWGTPGVADVPNTTIRISLGKYQRKVSIFALNFTFGDLTTEQVKARKSLTNALNSFNKLLNSKRTTIYKPTRFEAWMNLSATGGLGIANPASVFCTSQGGTLSIVDTADGQVGMCDINGVSQEEWAYYRAHASDFIAWPSKLDIPKSECTAVLVRDVADGIATPGETPQWLLPDGQVVSIYFRPVMPMETACKRSR